MWLAQAPSNIALIKYMGKKDEGINVPINPSLSYTLNNLTTSVVLNRYQGKKDLWEPLTIPGSTEEFKLSPYAQQRYLAHLSYLKNYFHYSDSFIVQSANNFPHSSGLASSASSFAALTKCAVIALCELTGHPALSVETEASLSRVGSGSSCRSFFSPWALWEGNQVKAIELPFAKLIHQVILISQNEKKVSSSEAHQRIRTSKFYQSRPDRAASRLRNLIIALEKRDWSQSYQICWDEFHDLHELFSTCKEPFSYFTENSYTVLKTLRAFWERKGDGPIITMDAGPNIHLLYRPDQTDLALQFRHDYLIGNYDVL